MNEHFGQLVVYNKYREFFEFEDWEEANTEFDFEDYSSDKLTLSTSDSAGRLPAHFLAAYSDVYSPQMFYCAIRTVHRFPNALISKTAAGYTTLELATAVGACDQIVSLFSLDPEEVEDMHEYVFVDMWKPDEILENRLHKWSGQKKWEELNENLDATLDLEEINGRLLETDEGGFCPIHFLASNAQEFTESLAYATLRMAFRSPGGLDAVDASGRTPRIIGESQQDPACETIRTILAMEPGECRGERFTKLLRQHAPLKYWECFGAYNQVVNLCLYTKLSLVEMADRKDVDVDVDVDLDEVLLDMMLILNDLVARRVFGLAELILAYLKPRPPI